jgi:hypothetical protein
MEEEDETSRETESAAFIPSGIKLTPEQILTVVDLINRKAMSPNDACPVCGSPKNVVLDDVYRVSVSSETLSVGGQFQPLISTVCGNCGFVRFFNRIVVDSIIEAERGSGINPEPEVQAENGG